MRQRLTSSGLTLSEILFALGVLALVALTLIGLFAQLILGSAKNRDLITAELIAAEILERAVTEGPRSDTNPGLGWGVGNLAGRVHEYPLSKPSQFVYRVDVQQLDLSGAPNSIPWNLAPSSSNRLELGHQWLVSVRVGWNPENPEAIDDVRPGSGLQWVEQSKMAYYASRRQP